MANETIDNGSVLDCIRTSFYLLSPHEMYYEKLEHVPIIVNRVSNFLFEL